MAEPLRVGIIGVGWGTLVHVPAFRAVEGYEPVALCSRRQESVTEAGARTGIDDVSTDWASFVARPDLDVVVVTTPSVLHHEITMAALEAGKHVLCEKPLSVTAQEGIEMADAAEARGLVNAVCYEIRWSREREPVWNLVQEGAIGEPYFVRVHQTRSMWHPTNEHRGDWFYRRDAGGGWVNHMSTHDLDFISALFGRPQAVSAQLQTIVPSRTLVTGEVVPVDADDSAGILLRLANGALGVVSVSSMALHTTGYSFDAFGSEGTVSIYAGVPGGPQRVAWPEAGAVILHGRAGDAGLHQVPLSDREISSGYRFPDRSVSVMMRAEALMLEEWLPAFRGEPTRVPTFRDGVAAQAVLDAVRRSHEAGGVWTDV
jgi:predicted dehydrogenase